MLRSLVQSSHSCMNTGVDPHLRNLSRLVVPSQQCHVGWVLGLQQEEQGEHFQAVVPSIHKVPQEDVAGVGHLASSVKELEHVMKLAMDVAAYLQKDRSGERRAPLGPFSSRWAVLLQSVHSSNRCVLANKQTAIARPSPVRALKAELNAASTRGGIAVLLLAAVGH